MTFVQLSSLGMRSRTVRPRARARSSSRSTFTPDSPRSSLPMKVRSKPAASAALEKLGGRVDVVRHEMEAYRTLTYGSITSAPRRGAGGDRDGGAVATEPCRRFRRLPPRPALARRWMGTLSRHAASTCRTDEPRAPGGDAAVSGRLGPSMRADLTDVRGRGERATETGSTCLEGRRQYGGGPEP